MTALEKWTVVSCGFIISILCLELLLRILIGFLLS